jgi:hypothetical protein
MPPHLIKTKTVPAKTNPNAAGIYCIYFQSQASRTDKADNSHSILIHLKIFLCSKNGQGSSLFLSQLGLIITLYSFVLYIYFASAR